MVWLCVAWKVKLSELTEHCKVTFISFTGDGQKIFADTTEELEAADRSVASK